MPRPAGAGELRSIAAEGIGNQMRPARQIFFTDSRVVLGATRRGRSPSLPLNAILRAALPHALLACSGA